MRSVVVAMFLSISLSACGSDTSNPVAACNSFASATCSKASSCGVSGVTSACAGNLESLLGCSSAACPSGQTFNSGAASQCISAINGLSCSDASSDYLNGTLPSACNSVCQ